MRFYILLSILIVSCAPMSPSEPKDRPQVSTQSTQATECAQQQTLQAAYNSVAIGARSYDVEAAMQEKPTETLSGVNLTQDYIATNNGATCATFEFAFTNDVLVSKRVF